MQRNELVHVEIGHCARDQRQQRHAPGRRAPDLDVRPPGHRGPPRTSSPVIAGMYVPGDSLQPIERPRASASERRWPPLASGDPWSLEQIPPPLPQGAAQVVVEEAVDGDAVFLVGYQVGTDSVTQ